MLGSEDKRKIGQWRRQGPNQKTWVEIGEILGVNPNTLRAHYNPRSGGYQPKEGPIEESPYPVFDQALTMEGDALVIPDPEMPFHNADFLNHCLELADAWGIRQAIVAGDAVHFASLSFFSADWKVPRKTGGLSEAQEARFLSYVLSLPEKHQQGGLDLLEQIGRVEAEDGLSPEIHEARKNLRRLGDQFDLVDYVIGNHDSRLIKTLQQSVFSDILLDVLRLDQPKWRIAPFYYSFLLSSGRTFRIEHPNGSAKTTAAKIAATYHQDVLMAHSHRLLYEHDPSGEYWAIQMGAVVDERRLGYVMQRTKAGDRHALGAVIVRDGFPYLLEERTPWDQYRKMK